MKAYLPIPTEIQDSTTTTVDSIRAESFRVDRKRRTILITYSYALSNTRIAQAQINLSGGDWGKFWKVLTSGVQIGQELDRLLLAVAKQKGLIPPAAVIEEEDYDQQDVLPA